MFTQWVAVSSMGGFFRLVNTTLLYCPMNLDGTRDDSVCEVDWSRIDNTEVVKCTIVREVLAHFQTLVCPICKSMNYDSCDCVRE
jgi:hypothetical protein